APSRTERVRISYSAASTLAAARAERHQDAVAQSLVAIEHRGGGLPPRPDAELAERGRQVRLHRALAQAQPLRDLGVRAAGDREREDLLLAMRERGRLDEQPHPSRERDVPGADGVHDEREVRLELRL